MRLHSNSATITDQLLGTKKVYRFEEKVEEPEHSPPPPAEHEEVQRTEWINPPTIVFGNGPRTERSKSVRGTSPSSRSTTTRRTSPSRTHRSHRSHSRAHSRRPSSPGTIVQERRTEVYDQGPPPAAIPVPPPGPPPPQPPMPQYYQQPAPQYYQQPPAPQYYHDHRTVVEERAPSRHSGALVLQEHDHRSDRDIQSEIRALEAERRALKLEREAEERRDRAAGMRERGLTEEEYELIQYDERRPRETLLIEERERERSPQRNVIRVEKDRKGRMALVRSAH